MEKCDCQPGIVIHYYFNKITVKSGISKQPYCFDQLMMLFDVWEALYYFPIVHFTSWYKNSREIALKCSFPQWFNKYFFNNLNLDRVFNRHSYAKDFQRKFHNYLYILDKQGFHCCMADVCWLFHKLYAFTSPHSHEQKAIVMFKIYYDQQHVQNESCNFLTYPSHCS